MSVILSLMIFLPLLAAPLVFFVTKMNRKMGVYLSLALGAVVLILASYIFLAVYGSPPAGGQYSFQEKFSWIYLPGVSTSTVDYFLGVDGLSTPLIFVSALLTVLVVYGSSKLIDKHEAEYYALIFLFEGAIMGVFTSLNLILFYIFWEVVLIPMFFFIGVWGGPRRKYAALKFIIFTYAGSTIMLLGFLYVYLGMGAAPSFNIPDLAGRIPIGLQYLPLLASFIGFAVKLPLVPFHTWLPDAHVEAPSPISVLLAGVLLKMGGYGFIRVSIGLFPLASAQYAWVFLALGLFSMFYGAIAAVLQKDLKKMIAFTSINHMGFVLFGAYATLVYGNLLGIEGAIFQMFAHALAVGALFMLSGYIQHQAGTREISLLKGLGSNMPRTAAIFILASAAAMGLPPFASFLAEFMVIVAGISAYSWTAISVLVPVITAGYFLWTIKRIILSPPEANHESHDMGWADVAMFGIFLGILVALIVASYVILSPADPVARYLWGLAQ